MKAKEQNYERIWNEMTEINVLTMSWNVAGAKNTKSICWKGVMSLCGKMKISWNCSRNNAKVLSNGRRWNEKYYSYTEKVIKRETKKK